MEKVERKFEANSIRGISMTSKLLRAISMAGAAWFFAATAGMALASTPGSLSVKLTPTATPGGVIDTLGVEITLTPAPGEPASAPPEFKIPLVYANVLTAGKTLTGLQARDEQGELKLSVRDDAPDPRGFYRHWVANRPSTGPLILRYRVPISNALAPLGTAPPLELRNDAKALSGMGISFLVLPVTERKMKLAVDWDVSALPPGAAALSSFGANHAVLADPDTPERLQQTYFMAGDIGRYPLAPHPHGFISAWQGRPNFDTLALMQWSEKLYYGFSHFFKDKQPAGYSIFVRENKVNPGGGAAMPQSFVVTYDAHTRADDLWLTISHEMFHSWNVLMDIPDDESSSWYTEGMAVFYARRLPLRFGTLSPQAFLDDVNFFAGRFYTNALNRTPNSELPAHYWEETRIRTLAYDRGSFYFASVDRAVRQASHGKSSMDDLLFDMMARRRAKGKVSTEDWEQVVAAYLGQAGVREFRDMLAGKLVVPPSDAFGPCFRRTTKLLRRYELGFTPKVLSEPDRIVRGLVRGSNAEKAGLRNGDRIVTPVGQDLIQGTQDMQLKLDIQREGRNMTITYLPRGERVNAYQWERVPAVPDSKCAL